MVTAAKLDIEHFSSFATPDGEGGNPAGVVICDDFPSDETMQLIAKEVGYSETVFSTLQDEIWRTRYFSPLGEVPFCGHATIALGASLALRFGTGRFRLQLNGPQISVEGVNNQGALSATLSSPRTNSYNPTSAFLEEVMQLFGFLPGDFDPRLSAVIAEAGARHLIVPLRSRNRLARMRYEMPLGKRIMDAENLNTIMLIHAENDQTFNVRNPFASAGIYEDPATGAAAATLGGYLEKINWPHGGKIEIFQGEDMGVPSVINVEIPGDIGDPVHVSGRVRTMNTAAT